MDFFDINAMIGTWPFPGVTQYDAGAFCTEMDRLHIAKALVFHSAALRDTPGYSGNNCLSESIRKHERLTGAMVLSPLVQIEYGGATALTAYMKDNGFGAMRLHPKEHSYTLYEWNMEEVFEIANAFRVPVLIDMRSIGGDFDAAYGAIHGLASRYTNAPIVLLTIGYRHLRVLFKLFEKCGNLYADTSTFITYRGIEEIVTFFGSERLLFGSRMPFIEGGVNIGRILYADISDADKACIAGGNARRMLSASTLRNAGGIHL